MEEIQHNISDKYLIERVLQGHTNSFAVIIKRNEKLVAQIISKMTANEEDRKDLAQDVFLKVYKNLATFENRSKLSTWIGQVTYKTCLNHLEKKKPLYIGSFDQPDPAEAPETQGTQVVIPTRSHAEIENYLSRKETSEIVSGAIEELPVLYKTLIALYHKEEISYEEIAQITDLPIGTVKSYLYRARKTLKDILLKHYKKDEL